MPRNLYKRGNVWWARAQVDGREIRQSLRTDSEVLALERWAALVRSSTRPDHPAANWVARATLKEMETDPRRQGFVYFIQGVRGGPIKIGFAMVPERRLADLQAGSNVELPLICCVPGFPQTEGELHARFEKERLHGEWFRASGRLKRFIADLRTAFPLCRSRAGTQQADNEAVSS